MYLFIFSKRCYMLNLCFLVRNLLFSPNSGLDAFIMFLFSLFCFFGLFDSKMILKIKSDLFCTVQIYAWALSTRTTSCVVDYRGRWHPNGIPQKFLWFGVLALGFVPLFFLFSKPHLLTQKSCPHWSCMFHLIWSHED